MSPIDPPPELTAEQRCRARWGENLAAQLKVCGLNVKQFQRALLEQGVDVTTQAIYAWLNGENAPTTPKQAVIARVLRVSHTMLFPIEAAA